MQAKQTKPQHTLRRNIEDGFFIFVPSPMILKTLQLLRIKDITPYAMQTVTLKALSNFLDSDLFYDYRCEGYQTHEILELFQAETVETIKEIQKELKK